MLFLVTLFFTLCFLSLASRRAVLFSARAASARSGDFAAALFEDPFAFPLFIMENQESAQSIFFDGVEG